MIAVEEMLLGGVVEFETQNKGRFPIKKRKHTCRRCCRLDNCRLGGSCDRCRLSPFGVAPNRLLLREFFQGSFAFFNLRFAHDATNRLCFFFASCCCCRSKGDQPCCDGVCLLLLQEISNGATKCDKAREWREAEFRILEITWMCLRAVLLKTIASNKINVARLAWSSNHSHFGGFCVLCIYRTILLYPMIDKSPA
jgi:hypothetical protein